MSNPRSAVPGPGVYEIKPKTEGPSYSFRPKFEDRLKHHVPGPGNYDPKNSMTSSKMPSWVIGRSEKSGIVDKDSKFVPGPGSYAKPSTLGGPMWRFGSGDRISTSPPVAPGPGAYQIKATFGSSPPYVNIQNKF